MDRHPATYSSMPSFFRKVFHRYKISVRHFHLTLEASFERRIITWTFLDEFIVSITIGLFVKPIFIAIRKAFVSVLEVCT